MTDVSKDNEARDAILDAITGFLNRTSTPHPSSIRDLAEAHALATGQVHAIQHTETNVKS